MAEIHHWDIKVYGDDGTERETIRGLQYARVNTLLGIFEREDIQAQAMAYSEDGESITDESMSVNWPTGWGL